MTFYYFIQVILPIASNLLLSAELVKAFYYFLQWWYLIMKTSHSKDIISDTKNALTEFSKTVKVFKDYSKSLFNFPKFHAMLHYTAFIASQRSLDNFMTEHFEY